MPIARVVQDQLSDGSWAYNVHIETGDGSQVVLGAADRQAADSIATAINEGASWAELHSVESALDHEIEHEDSPHIEDGVHNCNDWGTGEGRYHGRM